MIFLLFLNRQIFSIKSFKNGILWYDTNHAIIQGHGGTVQKINYDCFNNGTKECWVWIGEDRTYKMGVRGYASTNLYVWEDKGTILYTHNLLPEKFNQAKTGIVYDFDNLNELKKRANSQYNEIGKYNEDIEIAKKFIAPYITKRDDEGNSIEYDHHSLLLAYTHLYGKYCIVERPKMLYNKKYNNYVLIWHADGPNDQTIINWINKGMPKWDYKRSYSRAQIGFAISDNPFGPYKLVNVQRMHHSNGNCDENPGMARDMTVWKEENETAYVIYSSENNRYLYISKLDDTYTTWAAPNDQAKEGIDFKERILDVEYREAPAIFKYNGYYYLMTSGTSGWSPNAALYHRSEDLYGPWVNCGNPCVDDGFETTYDSQSAFFIEYDASKGQFIYFGDRWIPSNLHLSKYIWLPVDIDSQNRRISLHWSYEWKYNDVFTSTGVKIPYEQRKFISELKCIHQLDSLFFILIIFLSVSLGFITYALFNKRSNNMKVYNRL